MGFFQKKRGFMEVIADLEKTLLPAEKASLFTPVPGGIGPIAVVEIFANLVALKAGS